MFIERIKGYLSRRRQDREQKDLLHKQAKERCSTCTPVQSDKVTSIPVTSKVEPVFHLFPKLPGELRNRIWQLACQSDVPPEADFYISLSECLQSQSNYLAIIAKNMKISNPNLPLEEQAQQMGIANGELSYTMEPDPDAHYLRATIKPPQTTIPSRKRTAVFRTRIGRPSVGRRYDAAHGVFSHSTEGVLGLRHAFRHVRLRRKAFKGNSEALRNLNLLLPITTTSAHSHVPGILTTCRESWSIAKAEYILAKLYYGSGNQLGFRFEVHNPGKWVYVPINHVLRVSTGSIGGGEDCFSLDTVPVKHYLGVLSRMIWNVKVVVEEHEVLGVMQWDNFRASFARVGHSMV